MTLNLFFKKITTPIVAIVIGLMTSVSSASAATVTINELKLNSIFSQNTFNTSPIDIRISPFEKVVAPDLLKVTTKRETHQLLYGMASGTSAINVFFVDELNYCGGFNVRIVGCGALNSPGVIVETGFAMSIYGAELLAHEVAHNLGVVTHEPGLLSAALDGDTTLNAAQVAKILTSSLVQSDPLGLFVKITPIQIVANATDVGITPTSISPIPLPAGGFLLIGGLGCLAALRKVVL